MDTFTCPYCKVLSILSEGENVAYECEPFSSLSESCGTKTYLKSFLFFCQNNECQKHTLSVEFGNWDFQRFDTRVDYTHRNFFPKHAWTLIPPSKAKSWPGFIPEPLVKDYQEACLIVELSPKASATLARRCLQGMIRDFHGIIKNNLYLEIQELKEKVEGAVWEAIDTVRGIGNIGAHMETDINVIIDVEPQEAEKLIWLIEFLLEAWYVKREKDRLKLEELKALGEKKKR